MNSRLYSLLFAAFLIGTAQAADSNVPSGKANLTSSSVMAAQTYATQFSCDYSVNKPASNDWELTVAFHKEIMSMNMADNYPVVAEYRQNGTNMVFHTVKLIDGINLWPSEGVVQQQKSPLKALLIPAMPGDEQSMYTTGQWKCSVTMAVKGKDDEKVRFMSKALMTSSPGPSSN